MLSVLAHMMDGDGMDGGHWWGWLIALVVLGLVVVLVVWAITHITRAPSSGGPGSPSGPPRASAEEVLADRLARGEIDTTEYRERLRTLRDS